MIHKRIDHGSYGPLDLYTLKIGNIPMYAYFLGTFVIQYNYPVRVQKIENRLKSKR